jgi:hypothetical protein
VTGNLYVPKGRPFPLPGVIGVCGHSDNGKASAPYQSFAQGLARQGYVVLIFDPISQGERLQYPNEKLQSRIGVGVREHLYGGNQQFLIRILRRWRAWMGCPRLLSRGPGRSRLSASPVTRRRPATTWLCGVDRRWTMAAGFFVDVRHAARTGARRHGAMPATGPWPSGDHSDFSLRTFDPSSSLRRGLFRCSRGEQAYNRRQL